jgi:hypothetical protein
MKRDTVLDQVENTREPWDFLMIGGGATGLGITLPVVSLIKEDGLLAGAVIRDLETGLEHQIRARALITGRRLAESKPCRISRKWPKDTFRRHKYDRKAQGSRVCFAR